MADWPTSEFDNLTIGSDGARVGDLSTAVLNDRIAALKIDGFSYANGRSSNLELYAKARAQVYAAAGAEAVKAWCARAGV